MHWKPVSLIFSVKQITSHLGPFPLDVSTGCSHLAQVFSVVWRGKVTVVPLLVIPLTLLENPLIFTDWHWLWGASAGRVTWYSRPPTHRTWWRTFTLHRLLLLMNTVNTEPSSGRFQELSVLELIFPHKLHALSDNESTGWMHCSYYGRPM